MKRAGVALLVLLLSVSVADAFLPAGIEQAIRGWFNSAGRLVGFRFVPDATPPSAKVGACDLYMSSATNTLKVACNGNAATSLIGTGTVSCTDDGAGNLTCNSFNSPDQDPALPNLQRIFRNSVGRSCATAGVANTLTLLDTIASPNRWCFCDGTTQLFCLPATAASASADDTVLTGTGDDTGAWKTLPDCDDSGGQHLNYDATTNAFSCGTS